MPCRVGTVLSTGLAVYQNKDGSKFWMDDGKRVKLHGNTKWKTSSGQLMRGSTLDDTLDDVLSDSGYFYAPDSVYLDAPDSDDGLAQAIQASLVGSDGPVAAEGVTCSICLTAPATIMMRPCNHLCACRACSNRLSGPCVICRNRVTSMERVFF